MKLNESNIGNFQLYKFILEMCVYSDAEITINQVNIAIAIDTFRDALDEAIQLRDALKEA